MDGNFENKTVGLISSNLYSLKQGHARGQYGLVRSWLISHSVFLKFQIVFYWY